jgi:hypothetical protein
VANINFTFPDPDDPIFSGEFTVIFPIQLEESTDAGQPKAKSVSPRDQPRSPIQADRHRRLPGDAESQNHPAATPDLKSARESEKAAQAQAVQAPVDEEETDQGTTVDQVRTHLHEALDLLDELE